MHDKSILIIGAGPTGLGAGYRLHELQHDNWHIVEKNSYAGGLAASFVDDQGFTWDIGGHVIFSHYKRFDRFVSQALGTDFLEHLRETWIRIFDRWIPYPFQNNIRHLPKHALHECLQGLYDVQHAAGKDPGNFKEWILSIFGTGVAEHFMFPYNAKVWTTPLDQMSKEWIAERVAVVDFKRVLENVILEKDDIGWGPNNKFLFPLRGGTGEIFRNTAKNFENHIIYDQFVEWIDTETKQVGFSDASIRSYDTLISTMPLDILVSRITNTPQHIQEAAQKLVSNRGLVIGVGFNRPDTSKKCWMYFPEAISPCYRVTYFSNYSPYNVPDITQNFSLMGEVSFPRGASVDKEEVIRKTIQGFIDSRLISEQDRAHICSTYTIDIPYSYPVPTVDRDYALSIIQPWLESKSIYSRGRFGAWKYEASNMDHSVIQGMEVIDKIFFQKSESLIDNK